MAGWLLGAGSGGLRAPDARLEGILPEVESAGPPARLQRDRDGETCAEPTPEIAMRRLFDAHYDAIWRLLRRLGVQASQLDDAAQEVFWVAARKLSEIDAGSEHAFCELEELEVHDAAALEAIPLGTASSRLRRARDEFSSIAKRVRVTLGRGGLR